MAEDSGSESVGDIVADDDTTDDLAEAVETVVAAVAVEGNEADEVRRKVRQACERKFTAVRGAEGVSSSGSGSGLTVDFNCREYGRTSLAPESYTPLSSSVVLHADRAAASWGYCERSCCCLRAVGQQAGQR